MCLNKLKQELTRPTVLALYDPTARSKVPADVPSFGFGAVLLHENSEGEWKPVAYASRSLSRDAILYSRKYWWEFGAYTKL